MVKTLVEVRVIKSLSTDLENSLIRERNLKEENDFLKEENEMLVAESVTLYNVIQQKDLELKYENRIRNDYYSEISSLENKLKSMKEENDKQVSIIKNSQGYLFKQIDYAEEKETEYNKTINTLQLQMNNLKTECESYESCESCEQFLIEENDRKENHIEELYGIIEGLQYNVEEMEEGYENEFAENNEYKKICKMKDIHIDEINVKLKKLLEDRQISQ